MSGLIVAADRAAMGGTLLTVAQVGAGASPDAVKPAPGGDGAADASDVSAAIPAASAEGGA